MFNFKKKYHFVPPCPRCNSYRTGRFVLIDSERESSLFMFNALLKGELVETILGRDVSLLEHNIYCKDCGAEYFGNVDVIYLTDEEIKQQQTLRGITEELICDFDVLCNPRSRKRIVKMLKKQKKKEAKRAKKQEQKNIVKIKVKK